MNQNNNTEPKSSHIKSSKSTARLRNKLSYFLSLFALSLLFFYFGYTLVVFNTILDNLTEVFGWSDSEKTLQSTIHSVMITSGNLIGCLIGPSLSYKTGRYRFILATILISAVGIILTAIKSNPVIIVGRFISNLGSGVFQSVAPIIAIEMSPLETHTISSAFVPYQISIGVFTSFLVGLGLPVSPSLPNEYWRFVSLFPLIPCFIVVIIFVFIIKGDSGKFIYMKYKDEVRAKNALERVYKLEEIDGELQTIKKEASVVSSPTSLIQLWKDYRKQIGLGFAISFAQIGAGITYLALYSNTLIDKMEVQGGASDDEASKTVQLFALLCGILELIGDSGSLLWLGRFRRKLIFVVVYGLSYSFLACNWILGFAGVYTAQKYFIILSYFACGAGVAQFLYIYAPAIMSDSALGLVNGGFWAMSLIDSIIFPILLDSGLGINGTLAIYWSIGMIAIVYFMVAALEIKGLSQTQIFNYFNKSAQQNQVKPVELQTINIGGSVVRTEPVERIVTDSESPKMLESLPSNETLVHVKTEPSSTDKDSKVSEGIKSSGNNASPQDESAE